MSYIRNRSLTMHASSEIENDIVRPMKWIRLVDCVHDLLWSKVFQILEGRRLKLDDTHPHTLESLRNLIALYETWNKPEKAEECREKLAQIEDS